MAADFGIACLTPLNNNVFQEIGLMQGLQKPVLYLCNTERKQRKLPFDVDDQIYIPYTSREELEQKLEKEIEYVIDKVELYSRFEKLFRESLLQKVNALDSEKLRMLKYFLLENRLINTKSIPDQEMIIFHKLESDGLIIKTLVPMGAKHGTNLIYSECWEVNPEYRDILREIAFTK